MLSEGNFGYILLLSPDCVGHILSTVAMRALNKEKLVPKLYAAAWTCNQCSLYSTLVINPTHTCNLFRRRPSRPHM